MEVQIFETHSDHDEELDNVPATIKNDESIVSEVPPMDEAAGKFAHGAHLLYETIPGKVSRIRRDIEDLRQLGAHKEAQSLLEELKEALESKAPAEHNEVKPPNADKTELVKQDDSAVKTEFFDLEKRIARLEDTLGASSYSPAIKTPLQSQLKSLSAMLSLLSSDEESLRKKLEMISAIPERETTDQKINWLYSQLKKYDAIIDAVPTVIGRLQTLNTLHSAWVQCDQRLLFLEQEMTKVQNEMLEWKKSLETTEKAVQGYIDVSNRNIEILRNKQNNEK